jgi:hypothetical protein
MKEIILNILDYLRYQVANDKCTAEELRSFYEATAGNLDIDSTVRDMAEFYGQSDDNVKNVIKRHLVRKPKRKVLYNFLDILKFKPKSWKYGRQND